MTAFGARTRICLHRFPAVDGLTPAAPAAEQLQPDVPLGRRLEPVLPASRLVRRDQRPVQVAEEGPGRRRPQRDALSTRQNPFWLNLMQRVSAYLTFDSCRARCSAAHVQRRDTP